MATMRMAELARRSGLTVPTLKYYLREGLLQPGVLTSANQAVYDESHLERLRLIRALGKVAGLPLARIRAVVDAVSADSSVLDAMAATQDALVGDAGAPSTADTAVAASTTAAADTMKDAATAEAASPSRASAASQLEQVIEARGWRCETASPAHTAAVSAIERLHDEDLDILLERLDDYAQAADTVGRLDLEAVSGAGDLSSTIRAVVLGSALRRPLLDALVLLAQQHYAQELD